MIPCESVNLEKAKAIESHLRCQTYDAMVLAIESHLRCKTALFYFGFLMVEEAFTKNYSTGTVWILRFGYRIPQ